MGKTGRNVSIVGLGTWQLGADWGNVDPAQAQAILAASAEAGVTFFDTADVYGDGRSEQAIGAFLADNPGLDITVATKMGRRVEQRPENYNLANFREWTDRSRRNLGVEQLDLVQLHCPPTAVYSNAEVYDALDTLVAEGAIRNYGVSVERTDEALEAMRHEGTATVQIILNAFRLKPLDEVLPAAEAAGVGHHRPRAARLRAALRQVHRRTRPSPRTTTGTTTAPASAFDVGETFSGVDFGQGLKAVAEFEELVPDGVSTAQAAIAWIAAQDGVSTVIPGARNVDQARSNAAAADVSGIDATFDVGVREIYDRYFRESIHPRW